MTKEQKQRLFQVLAPCMLAVCIFLHFYKLGSIPDGFYHDESAIGYNAMSLLKTGSDEYGNLAPLFFRCFENYHEPVMVYSTAISEMFFGVSEFSVRLPGAIFSLIAAFFMYLLAYRYSSNRIAALITAMIFTILPWTFPLSRITMSGYIPMLAGIAGALYFMLRAFGERSIPCAVASSFLWSFAMYSHNCARPFTAAFMLAFVIAFNMLLIKRLKILIVFCSSFALFVLPMAIYFFRHPEALTSRFNQISAWQPGSSLTAKIEAVLSNYIGYFDPRFLFVYGDSNPRHHSMESGELYVFMLPLIVIGLYFIIRRFSNPHYRLIAIGLLLYPVAAMMTDTPFHATRSVNGSVFWMICALIGFISLYKRFRIAYMMPSRVFATGLLFTGAVEASFYMQDYFHDYKNYSDRFFYTPFIKTLKYSYSQLKPGEILYVDPSIFPHPVSLELKPSWYASFLFYGAIPPGEYIREGRIPEKYLIPFQGKFKGPGIYIRRNPVFAAEGDMLKRPPLPPFLKLLTSFQDSPPLILTDKNGREIIWRAGECPPSFLKPTGIIQNPEYLEVYRVENPSINAQ